MPVKPVFVFDLDDTLYAERDYAVSALRWVGGEMARRFGGADPAEALLAAFAGGAIDPIGAIFAARGWPAGEKLAVVAAMHAHVPTIALRNHAAALLAQLRRDARPFAIVTDGRSMTQRAKIAALACDDAAFVSVSEECGLAKTDLRRWQAVAEALPAPCYCAVGDNPAKDFLIPNQLGWDTVMLMDDGDHVHAQTLPGDARYHARRTVVRLDELLAN